MVEALKRSNRAPVEVANLFSESVTAAQKDSNGENDPIVANWADIEATMSRVSRAANQDIQREVQNQLDAQAQKLGQLLELLGGSRSSGNQDGPRLTRYEDEQPLAPVQRAPQVAAQRAADMTA